MKDSWHIPLLKLMLLSRAADKREAMLIRQGKAHIHVSSSGHEALMALVYQLQAEDYLYPYYRGCHLMMAKGISREVIARDFLAKASSSSQGRSMSAHCGSRELNVFPSAAPTASQCLPAVGTAWGQKRLGQTAITVCSIGDGATREGEFYEAVCFAVQYKLPIIFLIEDNHYAISTATDKIQPFHLSIYDKTLVTRVDGHDVFAVYAAGQQAINKARSQQGPSILWCEIDRLDSHTAGEDHSLYRAEQELARLKDPLIYYIEKLVELGEITQETAESLEQTAQAEILAIYKRVETELDPSPQDIRQHLYSSQISHVLLPSLATEQEVTMVTATNQILTEGLAAFPNLLLFGQDIEDPKGGVFGFTRGLSSKYPERVINAPIAEATIIGGAVGLAVTGFKPVFEIQFIDFITPGFDQLVTQVSSLRWRTCSQWSCPLVLYAPYGAYLPAGGLWHSQSNDGWWAHIPGLRVAIPSTAQDILELFWAAFQDEDPSMILIPKHIFRKKTSIVTNCVIAPFGQAKIRQEGKDVTVVAWGNAVELAEQAALHFKDKNIFIEVIDLRTLVPCDWETLEHSLAKTGRLVVVHEDNRTCGFGGSVIAEIITNPRCFDYLYAAPQLVARNDIHIPFHPQLEYAVLPSVQAVIAAIEKTLEQ